MNLTLILFLLSTLISILFVKPQLRFWLLLFISLTVYTFQNVPSNLVFVFYLGLTFLVGNKIIMKLTNQKQFRILVPFFVCLPLLFFKLQNLLSLSLLPPTGLSFITFIALAYLIDSFKVSKSKLKLLEFLQISFFFPTATAGPIERKDHFLKQIKKTHILTWFSFKEAFLLVLTGLFQKFIIANRLTLYINTIYADPKAYIGLPVFMAIIFFYFSLYADFAGYTNIARGLAKLFGVDLFENFNLPYLAISINDFWTRWHISLTSWLRNYVYIPLGGNRKGNSRKSINILVTFLISGLWHGNTLLFVIWGLFHGIIAIIESSFSIITHRLNFKLAFPKLLKISFTFLLVSYSWILFSAQSLPQAIQIAKLSLPFTPANFITVLQNEDLFQNLELAIILLLTMVICELMGSKFKLKQIVIGKDSLFIFTASFVILLLAFLGVFTNQSFYYAKF